MARIEEGHTLAQLQELTRDEFGAYLALDYYNWFDYLDGNIRLKDNATYWHINDDLIEIPERLLNKLNACSEQDISIMGSPDSNPNGNNQKGDFTMKQDLCQEQTVLELHRGQKYTITRMGIAKLICDIAKSLSSDSKTNYLERYVFTGKLWEKVNALSDKDKDNIIKSAVADYVYDYLNRMLGHYRTDVVEMSEKIKNMYDFWAKLRDGSEEYYVARHISYYINVSFENLFDYEYEKAYFREDCFKLNRWYPNFYREALKYDRDYEQLYLDQDIVEEIGNINRVYYDDLGIDGMCHDNAIDNGYFVCPICGRLHSQYDAHWCANREEYVCEDCVDNGDFITCEHCGDLIDRDYDNEAIETDDGCWYCCENCAENAGYHWSDYRDEWTQEYDEEDEENEINQIISDYHSHNYYPVGERRKGQKHDLFIGRETEVDGLNRYDFSYNYFDNIRDLLGGSGRTFFERDGSLDGGFETITQPHTIKEFFDFDWSKAFDKLVSDGWRSHDTTTCGTHYHFSSGFLGYNDKEKKNSAKKICAFFEKHWDEIVKLSRRKNFHYCRDFDFEINQKTNFSDLVNTGRYQAVNLTNLFRSRKDTIEIRIFRGTLNAQTMLADADWCYHIVKNAKRISWKNIDNLKLWFKGMKKSTIDHMIERNAFVGAIA